MVDFSRLKELSDRITKEPSENPGYEEWSLDIAEWRGEVTAKLDMLNEDIRDIKEDVKDIKSQNMKRDIKTAGIAGGMAIIIMIIGYMVQNGIG